MNAKGVTVQTIARRKISQSFFMGKLRTDMSEPAFLTEYRRETQRAASGQGARSGGHGAGLDTLPKDEARATQAGSHAASRSRQEVRNAG